MTKLWSMHVFLTRSFQTICKPSNNLLRRNFCASVSQQLSSEPNPNEKLIRVAIIGTPNAGKSTFINNLLNHRICPTSKKVHTTRTFAKAIGIKNNSQFVIFDTPGLVTDQQIKKHNLSSEFMSSCRHSIQHSDIIGVIHDISNQWTRHELHHTVLDALNLYSHLPSFLVLNKIDMLKSKRVLLELTKTLTADTLSLKGMRKQKSAPKEGAGKKENNGPAVGWPGFSEVFMISSLTGDGMDSVTRFLLRRSKNQSWEYGKNEYTDQPPEQLVVQSVRARLLDFLPQEMPYSLNCELEFYDVNSKGQIFTSVQIICPTERIERHVRGAEDGKLKQIREIVTSDLIETLRKPVILSLTTVAKLKSNAEK